MSREKRNPYTSFQFIYHCATMVMFMGLGIFILVCAPGTIRIYPQYKTLLGIILVVYSVFRGYKAYLKVKQMKYEEGYHE